MKPRSIIENNKSARRTVILRISKKADLESLIAEIINDGSSIVSEGADVIVIEGTGQAIEKLRKHKHIIDIDEPQRFQMRRPSFTRDDNDTSNF